MWSVYMYAYNLNIAIIDFNTLSYLNYSGKEVTICMYNLQNLFEKTWKVQNEKVQKGMKKKFFLSIITCKSGPYFHENILMYENPVTEISIFISIKIIITPLLCMCR